MGPCLRRDDMKRGCYPVFSGSYPELTLLQVEDDLQRVVNLGHRCWFQRTAYTQYPNPTIYRPRLQTIRYRLFGQPIGCARRQRTIRYDATLLLTPGRDRRHLDDRHTRVVDILGYDHTRAGLPVSEPWVGSRFTSTTIPRLKGFIQASPPEPLPLAVGVRRRPGRVGRRARHCLLTFTVQALV